MVSGFLRLLTCQYEILQSDGHIIVVAFKKNYLISLLLLLAACSGGNSNRGNDGSDPSVLTGQLIDSAVSGIRFETDTRSGVTDSDGHFQYLDGEMVRFYLGDLLLGDAISTPVVTLFDLVDGVTPFIGSALRHAVCNPKKEPSFNSVINLAVLLQTLDSDGNPDNGIDIASVVAALFTANSLDLDQSWQHFEHDHSWREVLSQAKADGLLESTRQLRKPWRAMAHLYASLGIDSELSRPRERIVDNGLEPKYILSFRYDDEGKLIRSEYGDNAQSTLSLIETYSYDADGNRTRSE